MSAAWKNDYIARCQIPEPGTVNIDHLTYFVPDEQAAERALTRMGFTPTPFSSYVQRSGDGATKPDGGGNHCTMFRRGYLGFLTPAGDTPHSVSLRKSMARYVGAHSVLMGTADAEAERARLIAAGFDPPAAAPMRRAIGTPDGEQQTNIARVSGESGNNHGGLQFVQQKTPELLWQQRWLDHPNRAFGLAAALYCVANPAEIAAAHGKLLGITPSAGPVPVVRTARGDLIYLDPDRVQRVFKIQPPSLPWLAGPVLDCGNPAVARTKLEMEGFTTNDLGEGRFFVHAPPELGGVFVFGLIGRAIPDFTT